MRSVVVALMLTRASGRPSTSAVRAHGVAIRADFWPLADKRDVHMRDARAGVSRQFCGVTQKRLGLSAFPLRVARREMGADIAFSQRAEDGVHQRVPSRVGVGMADQALVVRDAHSAKRDIVARAETVRIKAGTHACGARSAQQCFEHYEILWIGVFHKARIGLDKNRRHAARVGDAEIVSEAFIARVCVGLGMIAVRTPAGFNAPALARHPRRAAARRSESAMGRAGAAAPRRTPCFASLRTMAGLSPAARRRG